MNKTTLKVESRRCCKPCYGDTKLFFSLIDYRNNYFTSNDPSKIIEFYDGFENREQLIKWMRERPHGTANIYEVEGEKDIIVVIPTADFNGKYVKECINNIFKGLHIIIVESGEIPDQYFKGAYNVNVGIKRAMEYNPKWVVFSSDDMVKIDGVNVLQEELFKLDPKKYDVVFTKPSRYHSSPEKISKPNILYFLYNRMNKKNYGKSSLNINRKFGIRYLISPVSGKFSLLFHKGYQYSEIQDFGIYSSVWISSMGSSVYDETFINAAEDTDLSLKISLENMKTTTIDYKIGDLIGTSMGTGIQRGLRSLAGLVYLNWKWAETIDQKVNESA